jgi:hypothetical protein
MSQGAGITINVEKDAGWRVTASRLLSMLTRTKPAIDQSLEAAAAICYQEIMSYIATGGEGSWPALSESWQKRKGNGRFYECTGDYISAIHTERLDERTIFVGVPEGMHGDISYGKLTEVLEEDDGRPLYQPAEDRAVPKIQQTIAKIHLNILK